MVFPRSSFTLSALSGSVCDVPSQLKPIQWSTCCRFVALEMPSKVSCRHASGKHTDVAQTSFQADVEWRLTVIFKDFFSSFCAYDKKALEQCTVWPAWIIRFAVHILHVIFINVKIYVYIMAQCTKTSEIMLSMDGHNCSIQKRFSDTEL